MLIDVSIIIVSYNTEDLLKKCINSIVENTKDIQYEIIIVDNGSKDGTIEYLKNIKLNNITIIYNNKNLGFGSANNIGIKYSRGKYILFLNSDTILINNAIKIFYDYFENTENTDIGVLGCYLKNDNGDIIHSYESFPSIKTFLASELHLDKIYAINENKIVNNSKIIEVDYVTGADMFVSRSIIKKFNKFFDEDYFMYFEDTDIQFRLKNMGYRRIIIPGPEIIHYLSKSSKTTIEKKIMYDQSKYIYIRKNFKKSQALFLELLLKSITFSKIIIRNKYDLSNKLKYIRSVILDWK